MNFEKARELARSVLDEDPGLAAYVVRDYEETRLMGLSDLARSLNAEELPPKGDVEYLLDQLEQRKQFLVKRYKVRVKEQYGVTHYKIIQSLARSPEKIEHPGPGGFLRWGDLVSNIWFVESAGKDWKEAAEIAKRFLDAGYETEKTEVVEELVFDHVAERLASYEDCD